MGLFKKKKRVTDDDNYDRKEIIRTLSGTFGEKLTEKELSKRAKLWELADHTTNSIKLSKLSNSPYVEVRESVACNCHTPVDILIFLLGDKSCEVREAAVSNPNTPLNAIENLCDDESELVRDAVIWRKNEA
ncbi:MAG: hypothetical protein K2K91_09170 [Ruminococcus sp.]|nr:hypothetical protein [Ruminococcus sp.]